MKTDKVTREDLRALHDGDTRSYELPNYAACLTARAQAHGLAPLEGCRFETKIDQTTNTITITRHAY